MFLQMTQWKKEKKKPKRVATGASA